MKIIQRCDCGKPIGTRGRPNESGLCSTCHKKCKEHAEAMKLKLEKHKQDEIKNQEFLKSQKNAKSRNPE